MIPHILAVSFLLSLCSFYFIWAQDNTLTINQQAKTRKTSPREKKVVSACSRLSRKLDEFPKREKDLNVGLR